MPSLIAHGELHDDAWDQAFWFELPGAPRSKSNARRFTKSQKERRSYEASKRFAADAKLVAQQACPRDWDRGPSDNGTLHDRPQVVAVVVAHTTLDTTNVPKTFHDAVQGVVYHDDASVRAAQQLTVRGTAEAGGVAAFARLPADASAGDVARAVATLAAALMPHAAQLVDGIDDTTSAQTA